MDTGEDRLCFEEKRSWVRENRIEDFLGLIMGK